MVYAPMRDGRFTADVVAMMAGLVAEDPASGGTGCPGGVRTVEHFLSDPAAGRIVLFFEPAEASPRGYGILVPYWSNEFGGRIVFVDELYVVAGARGRGLARGFLETVERERPFGARAVFLEVSATNARARSVYAAAGYEVRTHTTMVRLLGEGGAGPLERRG